MSKVNKAMNKKSNHYEIYPGRRPQHEATSLLVNETLYIITSPSKSNFPQSLLLRLYALSSHKSTLSTLKI